MLVTTSTGLKTLGAEGKGPLADTEFSIFGFAYADEDEGDDQPHKTGHHQKSKEEEIWEEIHESMTSIMIFLIIIHIAGVLVSSWVHKENLVLAMITGKKKIL